MHFWVLLTVPNIHLLTFYFFFPSFKDKYLRVSSSTNALKILDITRHFWRSSKKFSSLLSPSSTYSLSSESESENPSSYSFSVFSEWRTLLIKAWFSELLVSRSNVGLTVLSPVNGWLFMELIWPSFNTLFTTSEIGVLLSL